MTERATCLTSLSNRARRGEVLWVQGWRSWQADFGTKPRKPDCRLATAFASRMRCVRG